MNTQKTDMEQSKTKEKTNGLAYFVNQIRHIRMDNLCSCPRQLSQTTYLLRLNCTVHPSRFFINLRRVVNTGRRLSETFPGAFLKLTPLFCAHATTKVDLESPVNTTGLFTKALRMSALGPQQTFEN